MIIAKIILLLMLIKTKNIINIKSIIWGEFASTYLVLGEDLLPAQLQDKRSVLISC